MVLTSRELNRATLARQLLLEREPLSVVDGVERVVALQAQEPASPYVALWNRIANFAPEDLDDALVSGTVLKATLMRITLHAVAAGDYPAFHEAMVSSLRASRLNDRRYTSTGMTVADADALIPHLSAFTSTPRTKAEIESMLTERLGSELGPSMWWALRTFAPLIRHPVDAPWSFGRSQLFAAAPGDAAHPDPRAGVQHLIRRYLRGFGPASHRDIGQFTLLPQRILVPALDEMAEEVITRSGPDGAELLDVPDAPLPGEDTPAPPRLMAMWDSTLLAYVDRSRIIPEDYRKVVIRGNGDVLPTLLVDGYVAGVWRPVDGAIEATAFHRLSPDVWAGLKDEALSLLALVGGRDPSTYSRYGRWWSELPTAEVRLLGD